MTTVDLGAVFSSAQAEFQLLSPLLWEPAAAATVVASQPRPGDRVLDVCCGAGASALLAAGAVGDRGLVDAVDLAAELLALGRAGAGARAFDHLRFIQADATRWQPEHDGYDVVQCVYGVFFLRDMDAAGARLASLLRPGGRFAVTTWERTAIAPVPQILVDAVRDVGAGSPPPEAARMPAQHISTPAGFTTWLSWLGLSGVEVIELPRQLPLTGELAWTLVLGGGMRAMLMGMDEPTVERVRVRFLELVAEREVSSLNANSLVGVGSRRA